MNKTPHIYHTIVENTHLDVMGHVNNAAYLTLLEKARWDFITQQGYGLKTIQETQLAPIILEINIRFIKELKSDDAITIKTTFLSYKNKIGTLEQQILRDHEVCCDATFTIGLFDLVERKLVLPTPAWLK